MMPAARPLPANPRPGERSTSATRWSRRNLAPRRGSESRASAATVRATAACRHATASEDGREEALPLADHVCFSRSCLARPVPTSRFPGRGSCVLRLGLRALPSDARITAVESQVSAIAALVLHATALADRYEELPAVAGRAQERQVRVARLRDVARRGRCALRRLCADTDDLATSNGEPSRTT